METNIEIPNIIAEKMKKHSLLNWKSMLAQELILRVTERDLVEEIVKKSKLTEKDVEEIDAKVKKGLHKKYYGS